MPEVDAFDLKMLAALQDDGRLTNQQLADLIGLSASQCSRRRMRLEEEKVIAGYHADLAGEALGFGLIAFIHITAPVAMTVALIEPISGHGLGSTRW